LGRSPAANFLSSNAMFLKFSVKIFEVASYIFHFLLLLFNAL
jgi:hypothetical protein